ncbi:MAG: asparagine synthase (glutamine-hydrolyzing) [Clostridia bacterium]|nr:asparagine synthase (glutamine-hydrolyzing) [Clostridia bacterium]
MCGIAGIIDYNSHPCRGEKYFDEMSRTLRDRGPDQDGMYFNSAACLIHRRLAVIDVENSRQPMSVCAKGDTYTIVYNGELYNTDEIKNELISLGHTFATRGDTEVVLRAYIEWGDAALNRFNGIFAFAIWREGTQELFFARDMMGVKPFYFSAARGAFLFASSPAALLKHPYVSSDIDIGSVAEIMLIGPGVTPGYGIFCDISSLPRGFCGTYSPSGLKISQYFFLKDRPHTDSFPETVEKVRFLVTDAIRRQLVSDVPVGTFLSGGLDSSIISAIAADEMKKMGKTLDTFSVFYRENEKYFKPSHFQPNSDDYYIDLMVKHIGSNHHEIVLDTPELVSALFDAVDARCYPGMADVDSSMLLLCREIKKSVTVALSGECADEIFGGYPWYRDKDIREKEGFPWAQSTAYRKGFIAPELSDMINPEEYVMQKYHAAKALSDRLPDLSPLENRMREMMTLNLDWFMQTLLTRKDVCSMYSSLEVRVPFCDKRITEYLYSTPWEYKDYEDREKGLLRLACEDMLPPEVAWRKKSPYPKTHHPAYLDALRSLLSDLLHDPSAPLWQIVNQSTAQTLISTETSTPWYGQLMTTPQTIAYLLQINYWMQKFSVRLKI